jgi:hypothetical protein
MTTTPRYGGFLLMNKLKETFFKKLRKKYQGD